LTKEEREARAARDAAWRAAQARKKEEKEAKETKPVPVDGPTKEERDARASREAAWRAAQAERIDREMVSYETAKVEYIAARRLKFGKYLDEEGKSEKAKGNDREYKRLLENARTIYQEIIHKYPHTVAASDAEDLLGGGTPPVRKIPSPPDLPADVTSYQGPLPDTSTSGKTSNPNPVLPTATSIPPFTLSGQAKSVYVHPYHNKFGTLVQGHWRH